MSIFKYLLTYLDIHKIINLVNINYTYNTYTHINTYYYCFLKAYLYSLIHSFREGKKLSYFK